MGSAAGGRDWYLELRVTSLFAGFTGSELSTLTALLSRQCENLGLASSVPQAR